MVTRSRHYSPLRYPGGKTNIVTQLEELLDFNDIRGVDYAEPFAGGAGLALSLLFDGYVSHIYLNDLDAGIFSFWSSILEETDEFCRLIENTPVTIDQWEIQKQILEKPDQFTILELGFAIFYLNRTNRSGIIKGGVIGGKDQSGEYKLDCRFNKSELIRRIRLIALRKNDIFLTRLDALEFISEVVNNCPRKCLTFLDPPYYLKGHQLYLNYYNHSHHLALADIVQNSLREPWIVTYDNVSEINEMYSDSSKLEYTVSYSAAKKCKGSEVMYLSSDIKLPMQQLFCETNSMVL
ncbi:MAG: DNA adenine methylase [Dehalococcoides mccartyi]|uniref:DNA adenine methylase n=1 Tax=Dehalococcoides mccartyi TaxID=61435 RepID=UPI0030FBBC3F